MELDYTVYLLVWCVPLASVHYIHSCDVRVLLGALVCIFSLLSVLALAMTFHIITAYIHTEQSFHHSSLWFRSVAVTIVAVVVVAAAVIVVVFIATITAAAAYAIRWHFILRIHSSILSAIHKCA